MTTKSVPPDAGLVKLVEALARAQARRDHAAELAARAAPITPTAVPEALSITAPAPSPTRDTDRSPRR